MSMIHVSRSSQNDEWLEVSKDGATIQVSELRVKPMSNWATPHQVLGKGGTCIALTDEEFASLCLKYLRLVLQSSVKVSESTCQFKSAIDYTNTADFVARIDAKEQA